MYGDDQMKWNQMQIGEVRCSVMIREQSILNRILVRRMLIKDQQKKQNIRFGTTKGDESGER